MCIHASNWEPSWEVRYCDYCREELCPNCVIEKEHNIEYCEACYDRFDRWEEDANTDYLMGG